MFAPRLSLPNKNICCKRRHRKAGKRGGNQELKRPAAPSAHARMHALRGVKCHICGDIGKHYSSSCPQRVNVGVPLGLRPDVDAGGEPKTEDDKKESPACSVYVPPAYLDAQELTAIIRKSPELPAFLRCRACLALPLDAIWCQCCDISAWVHQTKPGCAHCAQPTPWTIFMWWRQSEKWWTRGSRPQQRKLTPTRCQATKKTPWRRRRRLLEWLKNAPGGNTLNYDVLHTNVNIFTAWVSPAGKASRFIQMFTGSISQA